MTKQRLFPEDNCLLCIVMHDPFISHFHVIANIFALWVISACVSFGVIRLNENSLIRRSPAEVQKWRFFPPFPFPFVFILPSRFVRETNEEQLQHQRLSGRTTSCSVNRVQTGLSKTNTETNVLCFAIRSFERVCVEFMHPNIDVKHVCDSRRHDNMQMEEN